MGEVTPTELKALQSLAVQAQDAAYCPYSNFRVGAALLCADGTHALGANVENASYPVGTCAERVAVGYAVTVGGQKKDGDGKGRFKALAVATDGEPASPCGMCRQFLREFCDLDMPIIMFGGKGDYIIKTLGELLPMSFGPEQLPRPKA